jgi:hypothetical protein
MSTRHRAKGLDIDRMDRRKCRQENTAALLAAEVRIGRSFRQVTFSMRAPLGAWRQMPSSPGLTCRLPHPTLPAMSVRCTMTCPPDVSGLIDPDCCFFVSAGQTSRPRTRNPSSENGYSLRSLSLIASSLGQGVELSSGKKRQEMPPGSIVARARGRCAILETGAGNLRPDTPGDPAAARMADTRSLSYS